MLTHENVLSIFQACFRIGHYQTERSKDMSGSPLLEHTLRDMEAAQMLKTAEIAQTRA